MDLNSQKYIKELEKKNNIIGSLQGDILKLKRNSEDLRKTIKKLRLELKIQHTKNKRLNAQLRVIKKSASWKTGYVIVKALTQPGVNTLLLPLRLLKIVCHHGKKKLAPASAKQPKQFSSVASTASPIAIEHLSESRQFTLRESITPVTLNELRVVTIVDEFTFSSFTPECALLQITPANWQQEIKNFKPDMLFIEAAWQGKDGLWTGKIKNSSPELLALITWCNNHHIPTVFWAKEDPSDFATFLSTAKLFDFIFTTDIACIRKYKEHVSHQNVFLLPFAAQPHFHNPVEKYHRNNAFCFAGAYYFHFPERQKDFDTLYDVLSAIKPVDIYDRNYRVDQNLFIFPDKYKHSILGNLPHDQIDKAYKGYQYAINMNSIKDSETMFARRVFELLASNTIVVSNYSKGIKAFFGDLVICADDSQELMKQLKPILDDTVYSRKFRLLGLRKVLKEHTYQERFSYMVYKIWDLPIGTYGPHVQVIAKASNRGQVENILAAYHRQTYANKTLLLVLDGMSCERIQPGKSVKVVDKRNIKKQKIGERVTDGFLAGFVPSDYYGANYLMDIILATKYSKAPVIGKASFYKTRKNNEVQLCYDHLRYTYVGKLPMRSCIFRAVFLKGKYVLDVLGQLEDMEIEHDKCLSIDEFNYARDCTALTCPAVDDLPLLNTGHPLVKIMGVD